MNWHTVKAIGQARGALAALAELLPDCAELVVDDRIGGGGSHASAESSGWLHVVHRSAFVDRVAGHGPANSWRYPGPASPNGGAHGSTARHRPPVPGRSRAGRYRFADMDLEARARAQRSRRGAP